MAWLPQRPKSTFKKFGSALFENISKTIDFSLWGKLYIVPSNCTFFRIFLREKGISWFFFALFSGWSVRSHSSTFLIHLNYLLMQKPRKWGGWRLTYCESESKITKLKLNCGGIFWKTKRMPCQNCVPPKSPQPKSSTDIPTNFYLCQCNWCNNIFVKSHVLSRVSSVMTLA